MEDRPAIGGSFCLECPYTCTAVCIRYLKTYNPQYGKGQQYMDHIKQTYRMDTNNSERPVDALAEKLMTHWLTDNLESRNASPSKNEF